MQLRDGVAGIAYVIWDVEHEMLSFEREGIQRLGPEFPLVFASPGPELRKCVSSPMGSRLLDPELHN